MTYALKKGWGLTSRLPKLKALNAISISTSITPELASKALALPSRHEGLKLPEQSQPPSG